MTTHALARDVKQLRVTEAEIRVCFNCNFAEIDNDGEVWIEGPQTGHWLNEDQLQQLVKFKRER
ncbi:MAG: hypothetical protein ACLPWS_14170 [Rhodomicrobium sp.]